MFAKHHITVTTTSPNGDVMWEVKDAYGSNEDAALRGYLAFHSAFYVNGGSLNTVAALLAATHKHDGSFKRLNEKNNRAHKRAVTAHYAEELRRTDAYYAALRRDNPGW